MNKINFFVTRLGIKVHIFFLFRKNCHDGSINKIRKSCINNHKENKIYKIKKGINNLKTQNDSLCGKNPIKSRRISNLFS